MKLNERLNVLIQAAAISQKKGAFSLDDAVNAKSAIDIISSKTLNQDFTSAINVLLELAISSQKKGAYSLKDAYMIYMAIDGIETEFQNELNKIYTQEQQSNSEEMNYNEGVVIKTPKNKNK